MAPEALGRLPLDPPLARLRGALPAFFSGGTAIDLFLQRLLDALANGSLYGSLALALVVVYRASGRLNLAQGEMATFGTYTSLVLSSPASPLLAGTIFASRWFPGSPWPRWFCIPAAMVITAVMAALIERFVVRRIPEKSARSSVSVTIGLLLLVNALTKKVWRPVTRGYPSPFPNKPNDYVAVAGARLRYTTIGTWLAMLALMALLWVVLRFTKAGLAFRAVSSNRANSSLHGIRVGRVLTGGWAVAAALGTLAGCLLASRLVLNPDMMAKLLVYGFAAATIGGLTSLGGALLGGLLVGLLQTMLSGYVPFIGGPLSLPAVLLIMVIMLLTRPAGLFGTKGLDGAVTGDTLSIVSTSPTTGLWKVVRGSSTWRNLVILSTLAMVAVAILPMFVLPFLEARTWTELIAVTVVLWGLGLVMGPAGQLSLGHGGFVGVGAYTTAVTVARYDMSPLIGVAASMVVGFTVGALVGLPGLRIKGQYLAMVTIAWAVAFPMIIQRFDWFTGGSSGPKPGNEVLPPKWLPLPAGRDGIYLHLWVTAGAAFVLIVLYNLRRSSVGRAIRAAAENEQAAAAMGVNVVAVRTITFGLAAALGAIGGAMLAVHTRVVTSEGFDLFRSLAFYAAIAFAGAEALAGGFIGAVMLVGLPFLSYKLGWTVSPNLYFGLLILVGTVMFPDGLTPGLRRWFGRVLEIQEPIPEEG